MDAANAVSMVNVATANTVTGAKPFNQVFFPETFGELFSAWAKFPDAVPFAGGTEIMRNQGPRIPLLPRNILCLDRLEDLRRITRTERYLEIGAMVPLNEIIYLGKVVPEALTRCLEGIAGPQLRNLATIGGNLCYKKRRLDASGPMIALDALFELRSAASARWISAVRFASLAGPVALNAQELLTRIRVPLAQWDYSVYKKFKPQETGGYDGGAVFIFRYEKNVLSDLRLVFSGETILRDKSTESLLVGKNLPLNKKDAAAFVAHFKTYLVGLENPTPLLRAGLLNFIESSLAALTD
jgi:CO/xanthine dehydrogenase FAD-binding subunit